MNFRRIFLFFSNSIFTVGAMHFLGGFFTFREKPNLSIGQNSRTIFVEIRFQLTDHYFFCTPEQVEKHQTVYLLAEKPPVDVNGNRILWHKASLLSVYWDYYRIRCENRTRNSVCRNFQEEMWGFCESSNQNNGYSIVKRRFSMNIDVQHKLILFHVSCCWSSSNDKPFLFNLTIENGRVQNSSPYPFIPASFYVLLSQHQKIPIFVSDFDDDEILCEAEENNLSGFLTVTSDVQCNLIYSNTLGQHFGRFWLMDKRNEQILSRSLISVQINVISDAICDEKPTLKLEIEGDPSLKRKVNEFFTIRASIDPRCALTQSFNQTVTDLTTSCASSDSDVNTEGGIVVDFQCRIELCQREKFCFIGEFRGRLASTEVECLTIEAFDTAAKCLKALLLHDFIRPSEKRFLPTSTRSNKAFSTSEFRRKISRSNSNNPLLTIATLAAISTLAGLVVFKWKKDFFTSPKKTKTKEIEETPSVSSLETVDRPINRTERESVLKTPLQQSPSVNSSGKFQMKSQQIRIRPFDDEL